MMCNRHPLAIHSSGLAAIAALAWGVAGCAMPGFSPAPVANSTTQLPAVDFTQVHKPAGEAPGSGQAIPNNSAPPASFAPATTLRGQSPPYTGGGYTAGGYPPGSYPSGAVPPNNLAPGDYPRYGMPVSGAPLATNQAPPGTTAYQPLPGSAFAPPPLPTAAPQGEGIPPGYAPATGGFAPPPGTAPSAVAPAWPGMPGAAPNLPLPADVAGPAYRDADIQVNVQETETGRFMFGVGVNSDLGLTGQIVIDERNFDWRAIPTSWDDVVAGRAFRGAGQGFRLEAMPGTEVQRYTVNFTEPYLLDANISLSLGAYYFTRGYFDYDEERVGGNVGLGYRLTPDLSATLRMRAERVNVFNPRVLVVPELNEIVGRNDIYSGKFTLAHDTRDQPFFATEGHYLEVGYEQVFGDFDFPKVTVDARKYYMLRERPDGSGRHTLALNTRLGFAGAQSPLFENFFAGGYSTMRGFEFRGATPRVGDVVVGGEFQWLNTVEYIFPLTADDMLKGVVFCDFGTVERHIDFNTENFRVAPGAGLRISIPAMGPAPIALDFAFPVAKADTDVTEVFSFFIGLGR